MIPISPEIPAELTDLGVILGLINRNNGDVTLNDEWFRDPVAAMRDLLRSDTRRQALIDRSADLFGIAGDDLDLPDISDDVTWIPIVDHASGALRGGLHVIIDMRGGDPIVAAGAQAIVERDGVEASVTVQVPLVVAAPSGVDLLLGTSDGPIEAAATVIVDGLGVPGVVELDGVCLSAVLPTGGGDEPQMSVVAKNLLLPGQTAPEDLALGDLLTGSLLEDLGPDAIQMFVSLLSSFADTAPPAVQDLMALIGFGADDGIPPLPIVDMVERGLPALREWVSEVVADALDEWLARLGSFITEDGAQAIEPSGTGTADDPHAVCIVSTSNGFDVEACLTLVVESDPTRGTVAVTPGATMRIVADETLPAHVQGTMTFARLLLDQSFAIAAGPSVQAVARIGDGALVATQIDTADVGVGSVVGGFAFARDTGLIPVIEAHDVTVDGTSYDVIDLTDADAVVEAATDAIAQVIVDALGVDDNPEARALAILAGLAAPEGEPDWPAVSLPSLFVDPIGAIGCYHVEVLTVAGRWEKVAEQLAILLGVPTPAIGGSGAEDDPWSIELFDNEATADSVRGRVDLTAWVGGDPAVIHIGLSTHPTLEVDGVSADLGYVAELLQVRLPAADRCPAPVELEWAPTHAMLLTIDDPELTLDPVTISADRLELGLRLDRLTGLSPHFSMPGAAVTIDGVETTLGDLDAADLPEFGDLPWQVLEGLVGDWLRGLDLRAGDELAELLGWRTGDPIPFSLPQLPDLEIGAPQLPPIDLEQVLTDAGGALIDWLFGLFGGDGAGTASELPAFLVAVGRFAEILAGDHPGLALDGRGTYEDPWAVCLAGSPVELLLWIDPDGPKLGGVVGIVEHVVDETVLSGTDPEAALGLLDRAGDLLGDVADRAGDVGTLIAGVGALRDILEGDGIVTATSQRVAGWSETSLQPTAHLIERGQFQMPQVVVDEVPESGWIFVSPAAIPGDPWPGQETATTIDLTEPGIRPESIDLSHVTAGTRWHVLLPTRADAVVPTEPDVPGIDRLVARLRRAVDHVHEIAGGDLALIAHSTAGQVARLVAAEPVSATHVTHVVTVGTPHGGAGHEFLDRPETANALRALQRLRNLIDEDDATGIAALTDLLDSLGHALDPYVPDEDGALRHLPFPVADFAVPAAYPDLDAGTSGHAVVGSVTGADLDAAIVAFVRHVLEAAIDALPTGETVTHLGVGIRARLIPPEAAPGALSVAIRARADLHRFRIGDGDAPRQIPFVSADLELRRNGGWLVGGPDPGLPPGTPRDPRARWLEARLQADPTALSTGTFQIVIHDASIFGSHRDRWVVDLSALEDGLTLLPEIRILLGEIAAALGVLVVDTTIERVASLLVALGLGELIEGRLGLVTDAFERFIIDPVGELRTRLAGAQAEIHAALGRLLPVEFGVATHRLRLGEMFTAVVELDAGLAGCASLEMIDVPVAGIFTVGGTIRGCVDGSVTADGTITTVDPPGPLGRTVVDVTASFGGVLDPTATFHVTARSEVEGDLPSLFDGLVVLPTPDPTEIARVAFHVLAGDIARRAVAFVRLQLESARAAALDALVDIAGLAAGEGRTRNLAPLLREPGAFLSAPGALGVPALPDVPYVPCVSGPDLTLLLDALANLLDVPAVTGTFPLPWDASLAVSTPGDAGSIELSLGWVAPITSGAVTLDGRMTLVVGCGLDVEAEVAASIDIVGTGLDLARLEVELAEAPVVGVTIRPTGGDDIDLTLLPTLTGLGGGLAGGAESVLRLVLEAAAQHPTIGPAVVALGDGLAIRSGGSFDTTALQALAADPAGRLRVAAIETAFPALGTLLDEWFTGDVTVTATSLQVDLVDGAALTVTVPLQVCLTLTDHQPVTGVEVQVEVCMAVDPATPISVRIETEVVDPSLLAVAGISLFPRIAFYSGTTAPVPPDASDRFEGGLWLDPPGTSGRRGLFVKLPFGGTTAIVCRVGSTDGADLEACLTAALQAWLIPLAIELLLEAPDVQTFLDGAIAQGATTIRALLEDARILEPGDGLDTGFLPDAVNRLMCLAGAVVDGFAPLGDLEVPPFTLGFDSTGGVFGFTLGLGDDLDLVTTGDVRISLTAADAGATAGVTIGLFTLDADCIPEFTPSLTITDTGIRIDHPGGDKLVDLIAGVDAIELLASLSLGAGDDDAGIELRFENLTLPMGVARGTNPVAAKILSSENEEGAAGDAEELAPALSPVLEIATFPDPGVVFRLGTGDPPWWLPIQRAFGPIYVEQVGADTTERNGELVEIIILLDGEVSIAGLIVAADDLSLTIPVDTATDLDTWGIDLMGLAVAYSDSTITLAGGFRKNETDQGIEYVGMAQLDILEYGLSAIGAYGEFSDPALPGTTYTSMFVFAALSAPLGGPPFFFVTGIGAGLGLNRELVLPEDVVDIPGFPLVAAMDGSSGFASDPMGALEGMSTSFPGLRGTFWVAAGIRFTSFVLLETVAVLAIEIGDGVEVALIGVSHAALPDADKPVAFIELALIARFSTEEGILWVQAQLTDNSWLLDEDCRLTGGFAFVVWFTRGEFVFTVGGYHPRFDVPDHYPVVPPVGYNWTVDNALVIKGESYFALTSSAVMAGAGFEASYTTSTVWASLSAGVDVLVEWDPLFYDISAYVKVSAGIDVRICVLVCARVRMSFSMGASVRVWGPKLQGRVKLELGPIDVTVKFGSGAKDEVLTITWDEFVTRFLVQGNPAGESMSVSILRGLLTPDTGEQSETDDGTRQRPWRVVPEFTARFETRAASTAVDAAGSLSQSQPTVPSTIDVAPVGVTNLFSTFAVVVRDAGGDEVDGLEVDAFQISKLPDAAWKYVPREARAPAADYINAFTGVTMKSTLDVADDDIEVSLDLIDASLVLHPLPFLAEIRQREIPELLALLDGGIGFLDAAVDVDDVYGAARNGLGDYSTPSLVTLKSDRVSPPRLAPLTEGMLDDLRPTVSTTPLAPPAPPAPLDRSTLPPIVMGVLRSPVAGQARAPQSTSVSAHSAVPRIAAPTLAGVTVPGGSFPRAQLDIASGGLQRRRRTVVAHAGAPATRSSVRGRELRGGYRSDRRTAQKLQTITRRLGRQGHAVAPGDVIVLRMPNARYDDRPQRPHLHVDGDQLTRLVGLDRAGVPRWDETVRSAHIPISRGVERVVVVGRGAATGDVDGSGASGLSGWHAQMTVHQVASRTYLAPGAVIRAASPRTRREGSAVTLANVTAREATIGRTVVTYLPIATAGIVIGLSSAEPVRDAAEALASVTIGLDGAERRRRSDGSVIAPKVVSAGDQVFGVFAVSPVPGRDGVRRWIRVTVESDARWNVIAVGGATGAVDRLVDDLTTRDPASLFTAGPDPAGSSTVTYVPAEDEQSPDTKPGKGS